MEDFKISTKFKHGVSLYNMNTSPKRDQNEPFRGNYYQPK